MICGLERKHFVDPVTWEKEVDRIFSKSWNCVGRRESLFDHCGANAFRRIQIGDNDIILLQQESGQVDAFHNVCRHRGTRLVSEESGSLKNACVTCPYHAWTYRCDGKLIGAPNMKDVESFDPSDFGLKRVGCHDWCGFIMINPYDVTADFVTDFAPIIQQMQAWQMDQLELVTTVEYEVKANWKLIFQNYSECYHCPTVHPALNRLTPYRGATNDLEEGAFLGGPMQLSDSSETISTDGKRIGEILPGLNENQARLVYYYTLFPTMFLSPHPDYVMAHEIHPRSPGRTQVLCHFLSKPKTSTEQIQRAVTQWDQVNREDWEVCELTQLGVQSPSYTPGPYSHLEPMLIAFDQHYRRVMSD